MDHPNIIKLYDVYASVEGGPGITLVFELMQTDLAKITKSLGKPLPEAHVKSYMQMLLKGLAYCHSCSLIHRVRSVLNSIFMF
jgi:serine/threonine protein kinase